MENKEKNRLGTEQNLNSSVAVKSEDIKKSTENMSRLCREVGREGIVMLKNDKNVLPLSKDRVVSVFGRCQINFFYVGYGSGGDVKATYKVSPIDGMRADKNINLNEELVSVYQKWCDENPINFNNKDWGTWVTNYEEMPLTSELVSDAAKKSDTAVIFIGRSAGEDREATLTEGSFLLTSSEKDMIEKVCDCFDKVVLLLNCGNIIDMQWICGMGDKISSILYIWQGGMESGNSLADVLSGEFSPCGKLPDTIADKYDSYPSAQNFGDAHFNNYTEDIFVGYRYFETFAKDKVLYPFGFGMSYTDFEITYGETTLDKNVLTVSASVKNIGRYPGKETIQLYLCPPQGKLGKALRNLAAYEKTDLLAPGESCELKITFDLKDTASFDDSGITGNPFCFVLEKGKYSLFAGTDVRSAKEIFSFDIDETRVTEELESAMAPAKENPFERLHAYLDGDGNVDYILEPVPVINYSLRDRILENMPEDIPQTGDMGYKLSDVRDGKITMEQFVSQLSFDELEAISRGDYIFNSPLGPDGNAGVFGGVTPSLREKGIPPMVTTDGPSGIRLMQTCSLLPIGATLACTFNVNLVKELYEELSLEMADRGSDVLLAPGLNIHRNPLCGRNFEYFSEDPLVSGTIAGAMVEGVQSHGLSACPKHFACNNQEYVRIYNDSRVSERAMREIYLKGFEIVVKTAKPKNIMTSYNKINGIWSHYNYDLCTTVLRKEWKYSGNVMTDWWMRSSESPEFKNLSDQAYRVRAQVDVYMPGGDIPTKENDFNPPLHPDGTMQASYGKEEGITLGELQRTAVTVLKFCMTKLK